MDFTVAGLRQEVEAFLRDRNETLLEHARDTGKTPALQRVFAQHAVLTRPETFSMVREALEGAQADTAPRLRRLAGFLALQIAAAKRAEADEQIATTEARATPWDKEPGLTFAEGRLALSREPQRERRILLERALDRHLVDHTAPYARRVDSYARTAEQLHLDGWRALRTQVLQREDDAAANGAAQVLAATEDAFRDLLGYALRRVDDKLRALPGGSAQWHDLQRVRATPWLAEYVGPGEVLAALQRTLEGLELPRGGVRRLGIETEDRAGKRAGVQLLPLRVPDLVRVTLRFAGGVEEALSAAWAHGAAAVFASVDGRADVEDRCLPDAALLELLGRLVSSLLSDERWLRKMVRLSSGPAREVARLAAFVELTELRRQCASAQYELQLHARGASRELADVHEDLLRKALWVSVPRGFYLRDVSDGLTLLDGLRGWARLQPLRATLLERYDEDWWRNPGAGEFFRDALTWGATAAESTLAGVLEEAPLGDTASAYVRVMGA